MKFIIADDEGVMRDSISRFLEQKGHCCETASNSKEALEIIDREDPDAVIADLDMPGMNGFELLKIIKKKYPKIKVIILTASANIKNAIAASKYGAYGFCGKSEDLSRFTKIIEQIERETLGRTPLN